MMSLPAPTDLLPDEKEARILAAARDVFLERGYAETSMDLVAQRSRSSKTTLYSRFPSKEALFSATISAECARRGMHFSPDSFADLPIDEALRRIGRRFVDLIWSPEAIRIQQVITGEAPRFPEVARSFQREGPDRVCAGVAEFFAHAVQRGQVATDDPRFAAEQFLMALHGKPHCELMMGLRTELPEQDRAQFVERAVALFLTGVLPRA